MNETPQIWFFQNPTTQEVRVHRPIFLTDDCHGDCYPESVERRLSANQGPGIHHWTTPTRTVSRDVQLPDTLMNPRRHRVV